MAKKNQFSRKKISLNEFALYIVEAIETCGLSKAEIAERCGLSKPTIYTFIRMAKENDNNFSFNVINKLCEFLHISFTFNVK
jgi:transcriptional regulator with XRE-family HTH domain